MLSPHIAHGGCFRLRVVPCRLPIVGRISLMGLQISPYGPDNWSNEPYWPDTPRRQGFIPAPWQLSFLQVLVEIPAASHDATGTKNIY